MTKYEVLGVPPTATTGELRLAYLSLMKTLHPDVARGSREAERQVRDINDAYWTLRDPARRRRYDLDQESEASPPRAPVAVWLSRYPRPRHFLPVPTRPIRPVRPRGSAWARVLAGAIGVGAVTILAIGIHEFSMRPEPALERVVAAPTVASRAAISFDEELVTGAVLDFKEVLSAGGMHAAEGYSRSCYHDLAGTPAASLLGYCTAFDAAAGFWQDSFDPRAPRNPYFARPARVGRYAVAQRTILGPPAQAAVETEAVRASAELLAPQPPQFTPVTNAVGTAAAADVAPANIAQPAPPPAD